ncbi:MAG: hypothetical protein IJ583_04425 [Firmicutes bacterium]|nr:hypothetical protein [Bacillota bacterium]
MEGVFSGITSDSLMTVIDGLKEILPIALPAMLALIGLRKGIAFLKSCLKG